MPVTDTAQPPEEVATIEPEQETPEPVSAAPTEVVAEEAEPAAADGIEPAGDGSPSSLSHALARHEACSDCHAVDSRREPAPADHAGLTDDICLYCHMPEEGEAAIPPLPSRPEPGFCLGCHGPFEELLAQSEGYLFKEDLVGNPHMPIPHDSDQPTACTNCHDVHGLSVTAAVVIEPANPTYCFAACHHEQTFEPCSECHAE